MQCKIYNGRIEKFIIVCCAIVFSLLTVALQVRASGGVAYLEGEQLKRHNAVIQGTTGNPYQYRVLSEYLVEGVIRVLRTARCPFPVVSAFITVRLIQNMFLFVLAAFYYKALGLDTYLSLIGISLLAWGMTHAFYNSGLSFNLYFDVMFYLSAGLVILHRKYLWILPITGLAALNRETSGLIPLMVFADYACGKKEKYEIKNILFVAVIALVVYGIVFFSVRQIIGPRRLITAARQQPGLEFFMYNIRQHDTWLQLVATLGILPVMAVCSIRKWPCPLKGFFGIIVPIWMVIHFFGSAVAETRLFLVPHALIFIPGTLCGIERYHVTTDR